MAQAVQVVAADSGTVALLQDASIEVAARDTSVIDKLAASFPRGARVFINYLPGSDYRRTVEMAASLHRAGFTPVPHVSARSLSGEAELSDLLARLTGEAGVDSVFAIAGDVSVPRGPFPSVLDMLRTGAVARSGLTSIGFAGYPEGHHTMAADALAAALRGKLAAAREQNLGAFLVTQFCFEAQPILRWIAETRGAGLSVPVRVGIAGPASMRALLTFAMKCGIGASLRMLVNQPQSIGKLLRDATPDELVNELAAGLRRMHAAGVGLHLFPFGGVAKAAAWRKGVTG